MANSFDSGQGSGPVGGRGVKEQFDLRADPFSMPHDPRFLLASKPLQQALGTLRNLLANGSQLVVISGETGAGKTAFVDAVVRDFKDGIRTARILNPGSSWAEIGQEIGAQLRLNGGRLAPASLVVEPGDERVYRVVIDRAERLTEESLRHLAAYLDLQVPEGRAVHRLQIILLARNSGMAPVFGWLSGRQSDLIQLGTFDQNQSRQYILRRLQLAAGHDRKIFTEEALSQVARVAGGVPGTINSVCRGALEIAAAFGRTQVDADTVAEAWRRIAGDAATAPQVASAPAADASPFSTANLSPPASAPPATRPAPQSVDELLLSELTTSVSQEEGSAQSASQRYKKPLLVAALLILAAVGGFFGYSHFMPVPAPPPEPLTRIVTVEVPVEVPVIVPAPTPKPTPKPVVVAKPKPKPKKPRPVRVVKAKPTPKPAPPARVAPEPKVVVKEVEPEPAVPIVIPDAAETLARSFARHWVGDHTRIVEIVEHSSEGEKLVQTLKIARVESKNRKLTIGILRDQESEKELRVLSIETGKVEDERFSFRPDKGKLRRLKGRSAKDPFAGSRFSYDDFRARDVSQFLLYQIARSEMEGEALYIISGKPRYNSPYGRVEFVIDAQDHALLETHFFSGSGLRPRRILQYPRSTMEEHGRGLAPMRIIAHDIANDTVSEARVVNLSLARDIDPKLFTLATFQKRKLSF